MDERTITLALRSQDLRGDAIRSATFFPHDNTLIDNAAQQRAWARVACLVNERTALSTDAVREAFVGKRITYLKGNWTNRNPEITRLLERFGRSGVPLYLLYRGDREPLVLRQILTRSLVLDALEQI